MYTSIILDFTLSLRGYYALLLNKDWMKKHIYNAKKLKKSLDNLEEKLKFHTDLSKQTQ